MRTNKVLSVVLAVIICLTAFIIPISSTALSKSSYELPVSWELNRYNANTGAKETDPYSRTIRSDDYIDISGYDKITVSYTGSYSWNIHFYRNDYSFISSTNGQTAYASAPATVDVISNAEYMTISIYNYPMSLSDGENITVKGSFALNPALIDDDKKGSLTIHKYELENISEAVTVGTGYTQDDENLPTNARPINGVTFRIKRIAELQSTYFTPNGNALPTPSQAASMAALNTYTQTTATVNNIEGIAKFENLPLGIYLVQETSAPNHITKSSDFVISLPMTSNDNQSWKYNIDVYPKNQSTYANVRIKKADAANTNTGLSGASFNIWKSSDNSNYTQVSSVATDSNGYAIQTHLPVNNYYRLGEGTAPSGYILDNYNNQYNQTYFYLDENGRILSRDKSTVIGTQQTITYNNETLSASTITITNSKPTIKKYIDKSKGEGTNLIDGTTSVIADYSYFVIEIKTPKINSMSTLSTFKVTDNIQGTIVEPTIYKITKSSVNGTSLDSSAYTFTASTTSTGTEKNYTTELVFDTTKLDTDTYYYITYKAYVTTTKTNQATLVYSNRTISGTTTTSSINSNTVKFYRYSYNFTKVDDKNNALAGAQFQIFESEADARALKNPIKVINWGVNGTCTRSSNSSGQVQFAGLPVGDTETGSKDFWIAEIKAPTVTSNGTTIQYNLLADPIKVTVNNTTATYTNTITVVNSPKLDFPITGSMGTTLLIIIGILFLGTTFVMIVIKKKKQKQS